MRRLGTRVALGLAVMGGGAVTLGLLASADEGKRVVAGHEVEPSFIKVFSEGHDDNWFKADFYFDSPFMRAGWEADHIRFNGGRVSLEITREPKGSMPFTGAEYQRIGRYHYGRYEVIMRPAAGSGLVSAFFTHTDTSQGDPHQDEVDIEFLGNRTDELHINYFTEGGAANLDPIKLGYDASAWFQLYAFDWQEDHISWYVGDELVYTAHAEDHPIPYTPSRLILNLWTGSERQYGWHGRPTFESGARAEYVCVSYQAAGDDSVQCSDHFVIDLPDFGAGETQ